MTELKNAILHLRLLFSIPLMVPFIMALAPHEGHSMLKGNWSLIGAMFFILHFFIYPASHGHNSYYDKDEGSIGGLVKPPRVSRTLLVLAVLLDLLGYLLSWKLVSIRFLTFGFIYSLISQLYSHPLFRLKKYPWISFFAVVFFQGAWITWAVRGELVDHFGINDYSLIALSSLGLAGPYPLSQIYQHSEDLKRGDQTLSLWLGEAGTWHWCRAFLGVTGIMSLAWIFLYQSLAYAGLFLILGLVHAIWMFQSHTYASQDDRYWNYHRVMSMNWSLALVGIVGWSAIAVRI